MESESKTQRSEMLRKLVFGLLISSFLLPISGAGNEYVPCDCNDSGFWSTETIMQCQRASDFFIAVAYFSIPIELLYFVSCSNVPFKWILIQFIAFIVLCGSTHFLNWWTYSPHSFQLALALTIFKVLTALVSFATAITLVTLIPLFLKAKVREFLLKKKTRDLGHEVGIIKRKKEVGWHVHMLTKEIRNSLDRRTILHTTLVELSQALDLQNCAIWMPNEGETELHLALGMNPRVSSSFPTIIPMDDKDVRTIKDNDGVKILEPNSMLVSSTSGGTHKAGMGAAIRIPVIKMLNLKYGTPELVPFCYGVLVSVLPREIEGHWSKQELDIIRDVADQVAVALSHASILEESQNMRDQLASQNQALDQARQEALLASQARISVQKVMADSIRKPIHSILGLLLLLKDESLGSERDSIVGTMLRTGDVISTLSNDVTDISMRDSGRFPLEVKPFDLRDMVRDATCLAKSLCVHKGYEFKMDIDKSLPDKVVGDEKRVFQVILQMIGNILCNKSGGGCLTLCVQKEYGLHGVGERRWQVWQTSSSDGYVTVKFEIGVNTYIFEVMNPRVNYVQKHNDKAVEQGLTFSICKRLVQLMQGDICILPNPENFDQSMALVLQFQTGPSTMVGVSKEGALSDKMHSPSLFRGLEVLLADSNDTNRGITKKLLQKLGCSVSTVKSGTECLGSLGPRFSHFQVVILDLNLPDMNGYDVAERIRKFQSQNWPLIVALTVSEDGEVVEKCCRNGISGVIRKPVVLQGIADVLRNVLLQGI